MSTDPTFETAPDFDLLALVSDPTRPVGRDAVELFLDACKADADSNAGLISVNRVRERLVDQLADIPHQRYSAFWSHFTGPGRPMRKADADDLTEAVTKTWEPCAGSPSKNDGRPYQLRVWVGDGMPTFVTTTGANA